MTRLLLDVFDKGGWIMWPLCAVSCVVWFTGIYKMYTLLRFGMKRKRFWDLLGNPGAKSHACATGDDRFDNLLSLMRTRARPGIIRASFREFLLTMLPDLDRGLDTMVAWISVAPLLGLLGTVVGMIETFRVITNFGVGNPGLTAEGISIALLTTEVGLTVAFPALLFHTFIMNRKNRIRKMLFIDGEKLIRMAAHDQTAA